MTTVQVFCYGPLKKFTGTGTNQTSIELEQPIPVRDIVKMLGVPAQDIQSVLINGGIATLDNIVGHEDRIALIPLLGGG
jgi:sulfur carrier protein ThiS